MSTIDLTRAAFEPAKRYAGVRQQQGRVITDDDLNEAGDILDEARRRALVDIVGPSGSPDAGFRIDAPVEVAGLVDATVRAGTMYVGGHAVRLPHDLAFATQPDWPGLTEADRTRDPALPADLFYLEVWQQPVSAVEDRELAEPALGGPDTAQRLRTMARVRRRSVAGDTCALAGAELAAALAAAGLGSWDAANCELRNDLSLQVGFVPGGAPEDLCSPSVTAGYLGAENQALRVQLVDRIGGVGDGELTWGYDNGAPLYRARVIDDSTLEWLTAPRDEAHWPLLGQTIEVLPWGAVLVPDDDPTQLHGEVLADGGGRAASTGGDWVSAGQGHLTTLASSWDPTTQRLSLGTPLPTPFNPRAAGLVAAGVDTDHAGEDRSALVFVRVWHRGSDLASPARLPYSVGVPLTLGQTGLSVTLSGNDLQADAAWIIAARPATPDQVMPWRLSVGREPHGLRRFLVPLAVVDWATGSVHDCRETFRPLTRQRLCCRYTVGDGNQSHGDFSSLQQAIDNLPPEGGEVCLLPGLHLTGARIVGRHDVRVHGCGPNSVVQVVAPTDAVLTVLDSQRITLCDFAVRSEQGWAVQVGDGLLACSAITLRGLHLAVRDRGGLLARGLDELDVADCEVVAAPLLAAPDPGSDIGRLPLVYAQGSRLRLARNRITALAADIPALRAAGGLQIGGDSDQVQVWENRIVGGNSHGITLGSVEWSGSEGSGPFFVLVPYWYWEGNCLRLGWTLVGIDGVPGDLDIESGGPLEDIRIERNHIAGMGGDGIGVAWFFEAADGGGGPDDAIRIESLRITDNQILGNHTAERAEVSAFLQQWSGHGGIALAWVNDGVIDDNRIEANGAAVPDAVCGVFVLIAQGLSLARNRVLGNGRIDQTGPGWRGGLVLPLAGPSWEEQAWDGRASLAALDNQVDAPDGPALYVASLRGTVLVRRNELRTRVSRPRPGRDPGVSLGLSLIVFALGPPFEFFGKGAPEGPDSPHLSAQVAVSENVLSHTAAVKERTLAVCSVLVLSQDDVRYCDNVVRCDLGEMILLAASLAAATTLQANDNRLRETPSHAVGSLVTLAGANLTEDNLTTHCVFAYQSMSSSWVGDENREIVALTFPGICGRGRPG